jgi:hypothetical protein
MPAAPIRPPMMTRALAMPMLTRKASREDWPDATVIAAGDRRPKAGRGSTAWLARQLPTRAG